MADIGHDSSVGSALHLRSGFDSGLTWRNPEKNMVHNDCVIKEVPLLVLFSDGRSMVATVV